MTNLFITGDRGIGKSTLLCKLLEQMGITPTGFQTFPYYIGGERKGFYLHGLVKMPPYQNDQPICMQIGETSCIPITQSFDLFGTQILRRCLEDSSPLVLVDEIGTLEQDAHEFWTELEKCLDSSKLVIGVLKKSDHQSLERIKGRRDTLIYELKDSNREEIYQLCKQKINNYLEELNL